MSHHDTSAGGLLAYLALSALILALCVVDGCWSLVTRTRSEAWQ